jgi:hypothetical protein
VIDTGNSNKGFRTWIGNRIRNRNSFEKFILFNIPILLLLLFVGWIFPDSRETGWGEVLGLWVLATGPLTIITLILYFVLAPIFFLLALPFVLIFGKKKEPPKKRSVRPQSDYDKLPEVKIDRDRSN